MVVAFAYAASSLNTPSSSDNPTTGTSTHSTSSESTTPSVSTSTTSTTSTISQQTGANVSTYGDWVTYHGSVSRDGDDPYLPAVTTPSVAWQTNVDGPVYAEPISYNGSVFVATENDTLYSLSAATGAVQWSAQLGTPADSLATPYACDGGFPSIYPRIGVTGTPVIDASTSTLYVVALNYSQGYNLFAVNTSTGQIHWSLPVSASGFQWTPEEQRGALTLADGYIYVPFGSFSWSCGEDGGPFGWLIAVSSTGNSTSYSFRTTTTNEADIWTPEGASVGASGNLFVVTGNSYYNTTYNNADSVIELTPELTEVSYFAPSNWAFLGPHDLDEDTTGATQLPGNLVFSIGKAGVAYLLNGTNLGGIGGQLASLPLCPGGSWGSTSYANGIVYVPCTTGLYAVQVEDGTHPSLVSVWNATLGFMGPPIVAGGEVWALNIVTSSLYALNPATGAIVANVSEVPAYTMPHFETPSVAGSFIVFGDNTSVLAISPNDAASSVTVNSINQNGTTSLGHYTVLYSSNGSAISSGFTPDTFPTTAGTTYGISAESYGSCTFQEWSDGVMSDPRTFTATTSGLSFTAVYYCSTASSSAANPLPAPEGRLTAYAAPPLLIGLATAAEAAARVECSANYSSRSGESSSGLDRSE